LRTSAEAERMGAPRSLALCHYYIGATDYFRGRFPEAQAHLVDALALYQQVGAPAGQAVALQFLGMTATALGRLEEGRQHLERGVVVARRGTLWSHTLIRLYAALGRNRVDANDPVAARTYAEQGLEFVDVHGRCICNASIHCVASVAFCLTGDLYRAAELAEFALRGATTLDSPLFLCMAHQATALVRALSGEWNAAFEALDQARRHAEAVGLSYELGLLAEALPIFLRLGTRASAAQARSSLCFLHDQTRRRAIHPVPSE
jgi:tetratricopeptide (TPR) repeat protein